MWINKVKDKLVQTKKRFHDVRKTLRFLRINTSALQIGFCIQLILHTIQCVQLEPTTSFQLLFLNVSPAKPLMTYTIMSYSNILASNLIKSFVKNKMKGK